MINIMTRTQYTSSIKTNISTLSLDEMKDMQLYLSQIIKIKEHKDITISGQLSLLKQLKQYLPDSIYYPKLKELGGEI
jgi:hypothetical protein